MGEREGLLGKVFGQSGRDACGLVEVPCEVQMPEDDGTGGQVGHQSGERGLIGAGRFGCCRRAERTEDDGTD